MSTPVLARCRRSDGTLTLPPTAHVGLPTDFSKMRYGPNMNYIIRVGGEIIEVWGRVVDWVDNVIEIIIGAIVGETEQQVAARRQTGNFQRLRIQKTGRGTAVLVAC